MSTFAPMNYDEKLLTKKFDEARLEAKPFFLDSSCTLETLAKKLGTNRTYLSNFVNKEFGINFDKLMRQLRIEYAVRLMRANPKWSFRAVAQRSGFASDATFRKAFIEKYGMTPIEFRKSNGEL